MAAPIDHQKCDQAEEQAAQAREEVGVEVPELVFLEQVADGLEVRDPAPEQRSCHPRDEEDQTPW